MDKLRKIINPPKNSKLDTEHLKALPVETLVMMISNHQEILDQLQQQQQQTENHHQLLEQLIQQQQIHQQEIERLKSIITGTTNSSTTWQYSSLDRRELPLFELYSCLQDAGLPLGLGEYVQVIKALQVGFGLPNQQGLSRLCRALWVKNSEEEHVFNYHFSKIIRVNSASFSDIAKTSTQQSTLHREVAYVEKIIAQTTRKGLIGIATMSIILLTALIGLKFFPNSQETSLNSENSQTTELEETGDPDSEEFSTPEPVNGEAFLRPESEKSSQPESPSPTKPPPQNIPQVSVVLLSSLLGSMLLGTGVSWLLLQKVTVAKKTQPDDGIDSGSTTKTNISRPEMNTIGREDIQIAETISKTEEQENAVASAKALGQNEYFPLTRRQMKQGWRYLRQNIREGPKVELDIEDTVNQIGRQGLFIKPVMRPSRSNRTDLVFLVDQDGSMVPFQSLTQRLVDTAKRAGHLANASVYYFHNCPVNYLYHDSLRQEAEPLKSFLNERFSLRTSLVIISDAGAARGSVNPIRIKKTKAFLTQLNQYVRYLVWLNPLPQERWRHTAAGEIAKFVPMYEVNRTGFQRAIEVLRGRYKPITKRLEVLP